MAIQAINPATNEMLKTYDEMTPATVKDIVSTRSVSRLAGHYL